MGALVIPYWFIVTCVAVVGIFASGHAIGTDRQRSHGPGMMAIYFGPVIFLLSFGLLLFTMVWVM